MFGTKQDDSTALDLPSKTFLGVHFVLLGFDPIDAQKVRSKLVSGGGVDVGQYGSNCTHVLVDNLLYDDPICVTARKDGKILVTGLWVDHSFDIGMPVDPTSVMYIPLRDLDGIPGAKSLVVCLTGYQRQDRDDIMTMVRLMGANFSKPLVANKVTHLICYKFEGEKYELAKKMKKIKLVNHRWLEDCLRDWEILSEANYNKSGYELEMMESEAKDSEEEDAAQETDAKESGRKSCASPYMMTVRTNTTPQSKENILKTLIPKSASKDFPNICNKDGTVLASGEESLFARALNFQNINKQDLEVVGCRDPITPPHVTNAESYNKTPTSAKVGSNMATHSDKSSTKSYSRKTPSSNLLPVSAGGIGSNLSSSPKVDVNNFNVRDGFEKSSSRESKGGTDSEKHVRTSTEEGSRLLSGKRKMDRSYGNSKSQKVNHDAKACISECPSVTNVNGCSSSSVSVNASLDKNASPSFRCITPDNIATSDILNSDKKSFPKTVEPQPSFSESKMGSTIEPGIVDVMNRAEDVILDSLIPQRELHNVQVPSPKTESLVIQKSSSPRSDMFKEKDGDSFSKPLRKKSVAKKTLGSRPKLGLANAPKKGSIHLNETSPRSNAVSASILQTGDYEKVEMIPSNVNVNNAMVVDKNNVELSKNKDENKTGSMDDETEAPEDREEKELLAVSVEEKAEELGKTNKMNFVMKDKSEGMICSTIKSHGTHLSMREGTSTSCADKDGGESEKREGEKNELVESTVNKDCAYAKSAKSKKSLFGKTLKEPTKSDTGKRKSREGVSRKEVNNKKPNKKMGSGPSPTWNMKKSVPLNKPENPMEVEKENRPVGIGDQNVVKQIAKCKKMPVKNGPKPGVTDQGPVLSGSIFNFRVESIWFILSGHKLQRKEFQHVIKRLRGRVCRDSHQWSYQATHFIVPDPIRRTEKFFAAAASGRWILKTDYLAASNQAGRFLAEEPYEWHQKGLTEDGAINLEAPRKWRLLRDRTGHGAFYGMCVIIYGECIAPPLDTLKRVIKAGDGTILATSPPYTRFLNSGVDFAIVSPGMPRVDMWVQEFLRHEIPCVVADYLVEYVCKPGYSLEKHVQYNTGAWAERSFANLQARSEEVLEKTVPEDLVTDDIPCQVCGSRERGEVMLICGDESGTRGCGFGTHIDCCNPPLESVPQEDWFCPKCSERKNSQSHSKSSKKGKSLSKRYR